MRANSTADAHCFKATTESASSLFCPDRETHIKLANNGSARGFNQLFSRDYFARHHFGKFIKEARCFHSLFNFFYLFSMTSNVQNRWKRLAEVRDVGEQLLATRILLVRCALRRVLDERCTVCV